MEEYVDKYVPILSQSQISETLGAVLDRKILNKLELYEEFKFKELHNNILNESKGLTANKE